MSVVVELANSDHWGELYSIFRNVIVGGDCFAYDSDLTSEADAKNIWFPPMSKTYVALIDGHVVGSYFIRPNQPGHGSHIANCAYMVSPECRGKGVAQIMCKHSIEIGKELRYIAMQYNFVVSTNVRAVELWKFMGFRIIGTSPNAFMLKNSKQLVDIFIMYRELA